MHRYFLANAEELIIRQASEQDAVLLLQMFRQAVEESDFLLTSPEEISILTVAQEREFLRPFEQNPNQLFLIAQIGQQAVGILSIAQARAKKQMHVGELGITVIRQYWNLGIGRRLMQVMLNWAMEHPVILVIQLHVFAGNKNAIRLYKHFGFREMGKWDRMIRQPDGSFQDLLCMSRWLKDPIS